MDASVTDAGRDAVGPVSQPPPQQPATDRLDDAGQLGDTGTPDATVELDAAGAAPVDAGPPPPSCVAVPEVCDGKDNDCDGTIDNGVKNECGLCGKLGHEKGEPCSNGGQGPCAKPGTYQCMGETTICSAPPASPSTEICDNIDNDCDGVVDDGITKNACQGCAPLGQTKGAACSDGVGECRVAGTWECVGTEAVACTAKAKAAGPEACDGKDNDCDGIVDNGVKNACGACGSVPAEVCDGKDNDCDGSIDEGVKNACGACGAVPVEVCDGKDNDCDGAIDNGVLNQCGSCGSVPTWYRDCDNDGFAVSAGSMQACTKPTLTGCGNLLSVAPTTATTDCDDTSAIRKPGAVPVVSTLTINAFDEKTYDGDVDCNGTLERSETWQYVDFVTGELSAPVDYPVCAATCNGGLPCYKNDEQPGAPLGCGNTDVSVYNNVSCSVKVVTARLVCR